MSSTVSIRCKNTALGTKTINIYNQPNNDNNNNRSIQMKQLTASDLNHNSITTRIKSTFRFKGTSTVSISTPDGNVLHSSQQLLEALIEWENNEPKRLDAYVEGLSSKIAIGLEKSTEPKEISKAARAAWELASHPLHQQHLMRLDIIKGLVKCCSASSFLASGIAAGTIAYILHSSSPSLRDMLLKNGALLGLLKQLQNQKLPRPSDEIVRLHAVSGLCYEFDRSDPKQILTELSKSISILDIVHILSNTCTTGTKSAVLMTTCGALSRLLPYTTTDALINVGTSLTYIDQPDCYKLGLWSLCSAARDGDVRNILVPRTVAMQKQTTLLHTKDRLMARLVELGKILSETGEKYQLRFLSMAFWNFSSAISSSDDGKVNEQERSRKEQKDFSTPLTTGDMPVTPPPNIRTSVKDGMVMLTNLACNDDILCSISASAALANLAACGALKPTAALCIRLMKRVVSPDIPTKVTLGLSAAVAFLCRSRINNENQTKNDQHDDDDGGDSDSSDSSDPVGESNELFELLIIALTQRVELRKEIPQQHFVGAAMMYLSLPSRSTTSAPTRTVPILQRLTTLLARWDHMDTNIKNALCLSFWGMAQDIQNREYLNEIYLVKHLLHLYVLERPGDAPDPTIVNIKEIRHHRNKQKESKLAKKFRLLKESREKENKRLHALKDVGLAKTRQYIMGVAYLLTYHEICRDAFRDEETLLALVNGLNDINVKVASTCVGVIWKLSEFDDFASLLVKTRTVVFLLRILVTGALRFPTKTRIFALHTLSILMHQRDDVMQTMRGISELNNKYWGGDIFFEKALITILKEDNLKLNRVAGICIARLAMSSRQKKLASMNTVPALFEVVKRAVFQSHGQPGPNGRRTVAKDQLLAVDAATLALRNLSVYKEHQRSIAKQGLRILMQLGIAIEDPSVSSNTKSILHNISKNPKNRTTIYKAQLQSESAHHRCKAEMELRRVLELKSTSKSIKNRIIRTGATDIGNSPNVQRAAHMNETHWDLKRRRNATNSWLSVPQSAAHIVGIEDRLMFKKQPQLCQLLMRPMSKMFSKGNDNHERENLWEPRIVRYIFDNPKELLPDADTSSERHTKPRQIPSFQKNINTRAATVGAYPILKKNVDSRISQSLRRSKMMRPSTAEIVLSPVRRRQRSRGNRGNRGSRRLESKRRPQSPSSPEHSENPENPQSNSNLPIGARTAPAKMKTEKRSNTMRPKEDGGRGGSMFEVRLQPEHAHYNRLTFGKKSKPEFAPMMNAVVNQPGVSLSRWKYVEGNRISEGNYNYYELPDGRLSHFYSKAELKQAIMPPSPLNIPLPFTLSNICPGFHHDVDEPLPTLSLPPSSGKSDVVESYASVFSLPTETPPTGAIKFEDIPMLVEVEEIVLAGAKKDIKSVIVKKKWSLPSSVFASRAMNSDAKAFYDNDRVKKKAFNTDWANLTAKKRFVNMVIKTDDDGGEEELKEVKEVMWSCYSTIMDAFEFYSVMGTSLTQAYTIQSNAFNDFVDDCKITDKGTCKRKDIDTIFIVANLEEDKQSKVNKANDDRALMRFEFLDCVVRIAIAKYLKSGATNDVSDSLVMLCEQNIKPNLDAEAVHDSNDFRKDRLYFEDLDKVLWKNQNKMAMIFDVFALPKVGFSKQKLMTLTEWSSFMKVCNLYDEDFTQREAKLAFAWSQMAVADEIRRRIPFTCITFEDFQEAMARVCDMKALPTDTELRKAGFLNQTAKFFQHLDSKGLLDDFCRDHPCQWNDKKTRRMAELLPKFLDWVYSKLDRDGDGDFDRADLQRFMK